MMLKSVDLPHPDGPITPRNSPGATVSETSSTAVRTPSGVSNRLTMFSTTRMASAAPAPGATALLRCNVDTAIVEISVRRSLGLPRHRGRHGGCVTRFHPDVDYGNLSLLDRRDRLLEGPL